MTDDSPVPVDRLTRPAASAVFALIFALVVASLISQLATSAAVGVGVVAPDTNAFTIVRTVANFVGFLPAVVGYLLITDQRDLVSVSLPSLREVGSSGSAIVLYGLQIGILPHAPRVRIPDRRESGDDRRRRPGGFTTPR